MNINEKIYRNVKALAAINGMDMKEVEAKIGRSAGYLSRKNSRIDAEMLVKLSEILQVSIDELMNCDFEHELKQKLVLDELAYAAIAATDFFNEDGIITFVQNAINGSKVKEDEAGKSV